MKGLRRITWISAVMFLAALSGIARLEAQSEYRDDPPCPTISVSCPSDVIGDEPLIFKATVGLDTADPLRFEWSVYGGTIIDGQGTLRIKVQRLPGVSAMTASLALRGVPSNCSRTASCSLIFEHSFTQSGPLRHVPLDARRLCQRCQARQYQ